jgi:hypothetical protein
MFADTDPLEEDMGIRCEDMNPDQLVAYIKSYQEAFGLNLKIEGQRERAVINGLVRIYGRQDAGRIIKWVFYQYKGRYDKEPVTIFSFSKGRKWWLDKMHLEMQDAIRKERPKDYTSLSIGGRGLADL